MPIALIIKRAWIFISTASAALKSRQTSWLQATPKHETRNSVGPRAPVISSAGRELKPLETRFLPTVEMARAVEMTQVADMKQTLIVIARGVVGRSRLNPEFAVSIKPKDFHANRHGRWPPGATAEHETRFQLGCRSFALMDSAITRAITVAELSGESLASFCAEQSGEIL